MGWSSDAPPAIKIFLVGSWDNFKPAAMKWGSSGAFEHQILIGSSGCETFQVRRGRSQMQTIYPSETDASTFKRNSWQLCGPDGKGDKKYWKIGGHADDKSKQGDAFTIFVDVEVRGNVAQVRWERSK